MYGFHATGIIAATAGSAATDANSFSTSAIRVVAVGDPGGNAAS
jgi:hypothetical protein